MWAYLGHGCGTSYSLRVHSLTRFINGLLVRRLILGLLVRFTRGVRGLLVRFTRGVRADAVMYRGASAAIPN